MLYISVKVHLKTISKAKFIFWKVVGSLKFNSWIKRQKEILTQLAQKL